VPLVFAGVCSHAPGITGRANLADPIVRDGFYDALHGMRHALEASRPDVLVVVAAEHFANFFMNNMPSFAIGMADYYDGPIEDPNWLGIAKTRVPGNKELSKRFITEVMHGSREPGRSASRFAPPPMHCRNALPSLAPAVSRIGRPRPTRERSTSRGTATSSTVGAETTRPRCSTTTTRRSTPKLVKAVLRFVPSSPSPLQRERRRARCISMSQSRSSPLAAR
jgi:hypothetical protein